MPNSEITPTSPVDKLWYNIKRFRGLKTKHRIHCIQSASNPLTMITNNTDMANAFANAWSENSHDLNFPLLFQEHKKSASTAINLTPCKDADVLEAPISYLELESLLYTLKGKTPGMDNISYPMIKYASKPLKKRIVSLYNTIFTNYIAQISYKSSNQTQIKHS